MIILCEKCNKKFELADNLVPNEGRLLQCGSCTYQWHYIPESKIELVNEVKDNVKASDQVKKNLQKSAKKKIEKRKTIVNKNIHQSYTEEPKNKEGTKWQLSRQFSSIFAPILPALTPNRPK